MICPNCKQETPSIIRMCQYCNIDLEEHRSKTNAALAKKKLTFKDLICQVSYSIKTSIIILVLEIVLFSLIFFLKNYDNDYEFFSAAWGIVSLLNMIIFPIILPIFNGIVNYKKGNNLFVFNFFIIEITLILSFTILLFSGYAIDERIINGYDRQEELTGKLFLFGLAPITFIAAFCESLIIQIVLLLKVW